MFEIPDGLHENLYGLAWMIGRWEGTAVRVWPGEDDVTLGQRIDIDHAGPYLHYLSQLFRLDDDGASTGTFSMESGFWIPDGKGEVELVLSHPEGYSELWAGKVDGARIDLGTDGVIRSVNAPYAYSGGRRLYGNVGGKLMYSFDRATDEHPLRAYMSGELERA